MATAKALVVFPDSVISTSTYWGKWGYRLSILSIFAYNTTVLFFLGRTLNVYTHVLAQTPIYMYMYMYIHNHANSNGIMQHDVYVLLLHV